MLKLIPAASMNLRKAAKGILVLDARMVSGMEGVILQAHSASGFRCASGPSNQPANIVSCQYLPGLLTHLMNAGIKGRLLAANGFEAKGPDRIGGLHHALGIPQRKRSHPGAKAVAVNKCETVLCLQLKAHRADAGTFQRLGSRHALALIEGFGVLVANENRHHMS